MKKYLAKLMLILIFLPKLACASPSYDKLARRIMSDYTKMLAKEKGLYLSGSGGSMMDDIKEIFLSYISFDPLNVEEARRLYVEVAEGLLQKINQNEKIRPYLHNYPFTIENLDLMISFRDLNRVRVGNGCVALMFIAKDKIISYEAYDHQKEDFYSLNEEPYEEAVKIVAHECSEKCIR